MALGRALTNGRLWLGGFNHLEDSHGLGQAEAYRHLAIQLGETQHAEGLTLGDNGETRWDGVTKPAAHTDQYREDGGVDESAVGEVDQEWRGALRQRLLDLRLELSYGGQVQLAAHLNHRDTRVDRLVLDFGRPQFGGAAVVECSDARDVTRF